MRAPWFVCALAAALTDYSAALAAPMACSDRADMLAALGKDYQEAPSAVGLANNGALLEVLTSEGGATWTIIVSTPNGTSCLLAAGEGWQDLVRELKTPEL